MPFHLPMPTTLTHTDPARTTDDGRSPLDLQRAALRDLVALATESATTESQIERTFQTSAEQARKDHEKATWTLRQRYESAKDQVRNKHGEALSALEAQARATVVWYGFQPAPTPEDAPPVPATGAAEQEFETRRAGAARNLEALRRLFVPRLFVGPRAWLLGGFITLCAA